MNWFIYAKTQYDIQEAWNYGTCYAIQSTYVNFCTNKNERLLRMRLKIFSYALHDNRIDNFNLKLDRRMYVMLDYSITIFDK